ncbi:hypothetical protein SteCoe_21388 [Stentor coeruleus]|uniref:EF-hand domain-containing protein n=1 Tax=Stentor coeruleus TaxID=5963 RepID=A0A1R2BPT1_9CILI|nr:hypothetical protein SteCoe_21388 [Stentor coeruleus]
MRQSITRRSTLQERSLSKPRKIPDYLREDLKIAFSIYSDIESDGISLNQAQSILWGFGFWRMTHKEFEIELAESRINPNKPKITFEELLDIITRRYNNGGKFNRIKEIYDILNPKENSEADIREMLDIFHEYLEIPVSENELNDIFECFDSESSPNINISEFIKV